MFSTSGVLDNYQFHFQVLVKLELFIQLLYSFNDAENFPGAHCFGRRKWYEDSSAQTDVVDFHTHSVFSVDMGKLLS